MLWEVVVEAYGCSSVSFEGMTMAMTASVVVASRLVVRRGVNLLHMVVLEWLLVTIGALLVASCHS
jgi:uncharacterized protein (TIGR03382 family)